MKITTHIRNLIFLWRERNRTEIKSKNIDAEIILIVTKNNYKRKNSWVRNQVALLIRKIRKEKPYKIQDYSKAKLFYETQPKGIDFSKVKEGRYIVKFAEQYATKGKRYCEYHMNFDRGLDTFKVNSKYPDFFSLVDYKDEVKFALHECHVAMFRFATREEIQEFKNRQKEYNRLKKEIDNLQKQITKLYKEL